MRFSVRGIDFVMSLCREQVDAGRYFLYEHYDRAMSWDLPEVQEVCKVLGVVRVTADQYQYKARIKRGRSKGGRGPRPKPTKLVKSLSTSC